MPQRRDRELAVFGGVPLAWRSGPDVWPIRRPIHGGDRVDSWKMVVLGQFLDAVKERLNLVFRRIIPGFTETRRQKLDKSLRS